MFCWHHTFKVVIYRNQIAKVARQLVRYRLEATPAVAFG
jgi:hypothetical protein